MQGQRSLVSGLATRWRVELQAVQVVEELQVEQPFGHVFGVGFGLGFGLGFGFGSGFGASPMT